MAVEVVQLVLDAFTSYFTNIGKTTAPFNRCSQATLYYISYFRLNCLTSMVLYPSSEVDVARIINSLKGPSSSGPDCIQTKVVKFILPSIISPLTKLINTYFESGIFLTSPKQARVVVLHKCEP